MKTRLTSADARRPPLATAACPSASRCSTSSVHDRVGATPSRSSSGQSSSAANDGPSECPSKGGGQTTSTSASHRRTISTSRADATRDAVVVDEVDVVRAEEDHDEVDRRVRVQARQEVRQAVASLRVGSLDRRRAAVQPFGDHLPLVAEQALELDGPPHLAREPLAVRARDVAPRVRVAEADERLHRRRRIAFRSCSRISSTRASRSSTSSCSAWMYRPASSS